MGLGDAVRQSIDAAEAYFEPQLVQLDLGKEQIETQSLTQLQQSLETINALIAQPDSLGKRTVSIRGGVLGLSAESRSEAGALSVLLRRKRVIVNRMAKLGAEQGVQDLRALAAQTAGPVRDELQIKIDALEVQVKHWREQAEALDTAQRRAESERQTEIIKIELAERRSRLWRSFLERQSVATMLGALLLILMFLFIAIAAGSGAKVPELVSNAFLVILGYFFGQGGSSSSRNGDSPDARGA